MHKDLTFAMAIIFLTVIAHAGHAADTEPLVRFGEIIVEGNLKTDTQLIRDELSFREGDPFDLNKIDDSWEHLEDLGYFIFVEIEEEIIGDLALVTVSVDEDQTLRGYPIVDYDRRFDVMLGARIYDINFRGRGETVSLQGLWYRPHNYSAFWKHPWLMRVRGLDLKFSGEWETADFVYRDFDYTSWNTGAELTWNFLGPVFVSAAGGYGYFNQKGVFAGSVQYADPATRRHWRSSLTLGMDSRDLRWYPTRGAFHSLRMERISARDFQSYTQLIGDLRQFIPTPWNHVLALHAWGRLVNAHLPPEDRLYWGGSDTLRGYRYATIEGEEGFLLTVEYRWPLFLMPISADGRVIGIGLHAFTDIGSSWCDNLTREPLSSFGAGAHINIVSHQFRFEMARTESGKTVFQFMDSFNF